MSRTALHQLMFRGQRLICLEQDDQVWVVMRPVVEGMGLDWKSQSVKLNDSKERFSVVVITTQIEGDDQNRAVVCLPLEELFGWLMTVNHNRVKPEIRDTVLAYQKECARVLAAHFIGELRAATQAARVEAEDAREVLRYVYRREARLRDGWFSRFPRWEEIWLGFVDGLSGQEIARRAGYASPASVYRARARMRALGLLA